MSLHSGATIEADPAERFDSPSVTYTMLRTAPRGLLGSFRAFNLLFRSVYVHSLHICTSTLNKSIFRCQSGAKLRSSTIVNLRSKQ